MYYRLVTPRKSKNRVFRSFQRKNGDRRHPGSREMALDPVFAHVENYISELFVREDPALAGVEAAISAAGMPPISVSPVEGKLLHVLARLAGARRILELGTLGGYSTIWLARALPPGGQVISIELEPAYAEVARQNLAAAGVGDRVAVRVGPALEVLPHVEAEEPGPFDLIFIDADKPPYLEYLEWSLRLSRSGTLIVADNVIRAGAVLDPKDEDEMVVGVRRFNSALAVERRVSSVLLQTVGAKGHDGMALILVH
jgi:predicted O-methyltransferase YrrM